MKKSILIMLIAAMLFWISGCSLLDSGAAPTAQPDGAAAGDGPAITPAVGNTPTPSVTPAPESQQVQGKSVMVTLYFATEDNSAVKKETREVTVKDGAILRACVEALLAGPQTAGLRKTIPEGTSLIGISLKDRVATVDFTKEFTAANGLSEITARVSVVNTLTHITGIDKVRIHVEGKELIGPSGMPLGAMGLVALDANGVPLPGEMKTVTLYFGNSNADKVVAEKRQVELTKGELLEKAIFLELAKGPVTKDLYPTIPEGTRLLSVKTVNGLCTLDLSSEFVDNNHSGTAGESMTLNSIVNSLTELKTVKKVQFLIEGKKRDAYLHAVFDQPFSRNEGMIGKQ